MGGGNSQTPQAEIPGILDTSGKMLVSATSELPYGVTLTNENGKIAYKLVVGAKMQLKVDDEGGKAKSTSYTWGSTNPSIATINANGLLEALKAGIVKIYALYSITEGDSTIIYHIPIDITIVSEIGNGIPDHLVYDNTKKAVFASIHKYNDLSGEDILKYNALRFLTDIPNLKDGMVMTPGNKVPIDLYQLPSGNTWYDDYDAYYEMGDDIITDNYADIQFISTNTSVINIVTETDSTIDSAPHFYATALKTGKATIYAQYSGNKYVSIDVEVTGFNMVLDRDSYADFGDAYRLTSDYDSVLLKKKQSNGEYWDYCYVRCTGINDVIRNTFFDFNPDDDFENEIILLKVLPIDGVNITQVTWTQKPVGFSDYPAIPNLLKITTSDNGKKIQIKAKASTYTEGVYTQGMTQITGIANNGMTYSLIIWL